MSSASAPSSAAWTAFTTAMATFRAGLDDEGRYQEILSTTSIDQVYDLTDKLQRTQRAHLTNLARIEPYLEGMRAYTRAIDTFVSAKPEILALIWGPIKLLIELTSTLTRSLDELAKTLEKIGGLLPELDHAARLFGHKDHVNQVLATLFHDILQFYLVALKFFSMRKWKTLFEAFWPMKRIELNEIIDKMKRHTADLRNEIRMEDIQSTHQTRRTLEYSTLQTDLHPLFYDKKLQSLLGNVCPGTANWLLNDPDVVKWMEATGDSSKVIWLHGLPGAGKSHLSACVIEASISRCRTAFVLLSHDIPDTSELSVMHSLIFQLARGDPNLQDMVLAANLDSLRIDRSAAVTLLVNMVNLLDNARIIVDGLDEIDNRVADRLLNCLLEISNNCEGARVLISSRPETQIKLVLDSVSKPIRADSHNTSSIDLFVKQRFAEWLHHRTFSTEELDEIYQLRDRIAVGAKGMFLYAHLILRSLDFLHSIDEIRRDLTVLPSDLNQAYERIWRRINEHLPTNTVREKARQILGWVGCSPVPLTIRELEQALLINPADIEQRPTGMSGMTVLDIVRICGPVVEDANDELHFVHFTAKQYFFSKDIKESLDASRYTLKLTICCIDYLCQTHHDCDIDETQFQQNVVDGVYRFHHYASSMWAKLVESYFKLTGDAGDPDRLGRLVQRLEVLRAFRGNDNFCALDRQYNNEALAHLSQQGTVDAYKLVLGELQLQDAAATRLFELGESKRGDWRQADPLEIRHITHSLHASLERRICPPSGHRSSCHCQDLIRHYGPRVFKCAFIGCEYQRLGFETVRDRDSHTKTHDRPWTCDVAGCEYSEEGFVSRQMRDRHLDTAHRPGIHKTSREIQGTTAEDSEKVALLKALIKKNKLGESILQTIKFGKLTVTDKWLVFQKAASCGNSQAMECLVPYSFDLELFIKVKTTRTFTVLETLLSLGVNLLPFALDALNYHFLEWFKLKTQGQLRYFELQLLLVNSYLPAAEAAWRALVRCGESPTIIQQYLGETFVSFLGYNSDLYGQHGDRYWPGWARGFHMRILRQTRDNPTAEHLLLSVWDYVDKHNYQSETSKAHWSLLLCDVARTTCSTTLADWLFEHGADVNGDRGLGAPRVFYYRRGPPLIAAARKDTARSARFLQWLLHHGANPSLLPVRGLPISSLKGPTGISKWLGISWEELVEATAEVRKKNESVLFWEEGEPKIPPTDGNRSLASQQAYYMKLMLAEQQRKKELMMKGQEDHAVQDSQMQLMLLEQQKKIKETREMQAKKKSVDG